ncbi:hypothetical protein [Streptomyces boncukensis]|uniref:hypothetical protein n=1 Tax=Streptomyces boncukensis TaxID=2711219 RepID=UPI001F49D1A9|nr:hypothetical protein [Streptomyces boncukensis]
MSSLTTFGSPSSNPSPFQSRARGVGNAAIRARNVSLRFPSNRPGPFPSFVVGVGSSIPREREDELAEPLMRSEDLRSPYACPFRIEPEAGQVAEYGAKSSKNEG